MRCEEVVRLIDREGVTGNTRHAGAREHLAGCASCRRALSAQRALLSALAADPARQVGADFEQRLFARLQTAPQASPLAGWWKRLQFHASWRLQPTLAVAAGMAA